MSPQEFRLGRRWGRATQAVILSGYSSIDAEGGGLRLFSVQAGSDILDATSYRVVVIGGRRYEPKLMEAGGLGNGSTKLNSVVFSLDPKALVPDKVAYLGVEQVNSVRNP